MVNPQESATAIKPKALVISRPDDFAAAVLASVVLGPTRNALPDTRIYLLIQEKFAPLYVDHPSLDGIFTVSSDSTAEELAAHFKKQKVDALVHLAYSEKVAKAAQLAELPISIAHAGEHEDNVSLEILSSKAQAIRHAAFRNFDLLRPFGVEIPEHPEIKLAVYEEAREEIFTELEKNYGLSQQHSYAVFCLDANYSGHKIDTSVFAKTAEWVTRQSGMPILIVGNASNSEFLRFSRNSHGAHIIDMRGKTTPAEAAWILRSARFCFSGENAYAYLSVAMNCPLIALFVDFTAERWFPLGHFSTNIFTGARRFPLEPKFLYDYRASRAFKIEKIASALRFSLALKAE